MPWPTETVADYILPGYISVSRCSGDCSSQVGLRILDLKDIHSIRTYLLEPVFLGMILTNQTLWGREGCGSESWVNGDA